MAQQQPIYVIKSKMNALVLDVAKAATNPGAAVIMYKQSSKDNQMWYDDPATGTIRSKQTGFCLDLEGDNLVVKPYDKHAMTQLWERSGTSLRSKKSRKSIDIIGRNKESGAAIGCFDYHGGDNQQWDFIDLKGVPVPPPGCAVAQSVQQAFGQKGTRREFYIESALHGKVLDIEGANPGPGAALIMFGKKSPIVKNQLWYVDQQGLVRCALNDLTFTNKAAGEVLKMGAVTDDPRTKWKIAGAAVMNGSGECLDLSRSNKNDSAPLISYKYKSSVNQHWKIVYMS